MAKKGKTRLIKNIATGFFSLDKVRPRIFEAYGRLTHRSHPAVFCLHKEQYKSMRLDIKKHFLIGKEYFLKIEELCTLGQSQCS